MAILTKAQLQAANSASFPNNNSQAITPQILRDYNSSVIDTLVDSLDTGSFARTDVTNTFTQTNNFTSISASAFVSASNFIGDGSKLTNITASTALPILDEGVLQGYATSMNFTGSAISAQVIAGTAVVQVNISNVGLVTTASFNAYTQSTNEFTASTNQFTQSASSSISQLNASTASQQVSINALNVYTASQSTASIVNSITELNTFSASAKIELVNLNTSVTNLNSFSSSTNSSITQLNANTASQQVSINNLNTTTASLLIETQNLELFSASALISISNLNQSSASQQVSINALNATSASTLTSLSNLNTATASLFTSASLTLTTASFNTGTRNLTFTKGDTQTFSVNIPDASGSTIPAGTISSSAQITALGFVSSSITGGVFVSASQAFPNQIQLYYGDGNSVAVQINNVENAISASYALTASYALNANVNTGSLVTTASFNQYTQSNNQRVSSLEVNSASVNTSVTNLNSATSSLFTSASLGLVTASAVGNTITFTKGNGNTFNVSVSSTPIDTSSFATTGSNTFIGNQTITGSLFQSGSLVQIGNTNLLGSTTLSGSVFVSGNIEVTNGANLITHNVKAAGSNGLDILANNGATIATMGQGGGTQAQFLGSLSANSFSSSTINGLGNPLTFSTSVDSRLDSLEGITASVNTSASLALYTASFDTGSRNLTFTKGDTTTFAVNIPDVSGSTINTGSFATTGSNVFTGDQTLIDNAGNFYTISDASGSMLLVAKGFTSASAHISSSIPTTGSNVNLIFKFNDQTGDTIISGSGNIFSNQTAPAAGFKKYIGGNQNIFSGIASVPNITGSMQFSPAMNTNYLAGITTMRGPISSSAWSIAQNNILGNLNIGSAGLNAEKLTSGLSLSGNYVGGTLSINAFNDALTGSTTTLSNNNINGSATLTLVSSAATFNGNSINDGAFSLLNQYFSSSVGLGAVTIQRNTIAGNTNTFSITGSVQATTTGQPQINDNLIGGANNTIFSNYSNSRTSGLNTYGNFHRSIVYGNTLIVTASMSAGETNTQGSAFFGRFNVNDGIRNKSDYAVFSVGTGNGTTRKTGFLIDSGSNTFVEGTLNVSGATSLNGDLNITGSLTASLQQGFVYVGNSSGITTTVATSSFGGTLPSGVISGSAQITALGFVSSSITASSLVTASVNLNTITFTKGDSSTFQLTVNTGSGGGGGGFPYVGDAVITGSLTVSGSGIPDIRLIGNIDVTGSLRVQPITLSVASQTASIDMNASNYFILNLPTSSTTHVAFTNIIPGESINLLVSQSATVATGSIAFAPNIYFPGGNDYVATATGSARDIVSFITFNTAEIYATNVKNLK